MANPNVGEIWKCKTTSQNETGEDEHRYKVVALADKVSDYGATVVPDYWAVVAYINDNTAAAGFRQRIRRSYMGDANSPWSIESAVPVP